jgi:alkylation response protein AidB-like acyl-CoA dehydrogenase
MNFAFTEEQQAVRDTFAKFVDERVKPAAASIDEQAEFPRALFAEVGTLGFYGMRYPESAGGSGMDVISYCLAVIELSRGSLSLAAAVTMQSLMATYFLYRFGDDDIKQNYFTPALNGEKIGAICMTEPNAGTDLNGIQTKASIGDNGFVLNGQKTWVTSARVADFFTVVARTENIDKLSIYFVPANTPGVVIGKNIEKLGVCGSVTNEVYFEDAKIPKRYLLGELGAGPKYLGEVLAEIRIMTAALAIGVATAAFDDAIAYAKVRQQFGKTIGTFQAIKMKAADMAVELETSRHMLFYAAWLCDQKLPRQKEAMMVKLYASECANKICDDASRIMASYGFAMEYPMQRYLRDARFTLIGGGTSEILKVNIAKELGL